MKKEKWFVWGMGMLALLFCLMNAMAARSTTDWKAEWNRMDGSTATIPLSEALMERLLSMEDGAAVGKVKHSTTPVAYVRLIDAALGNINIGQGPEVADLIFVTPPSEEELAYAISRDVELEVIPIAKDALVFLNNTRNPVEGMTAEQVKAIYQGKITRWSEVGGEEEGIVAYQRPGNSGSQTLFEQLLMQGEEPMEAPDGWSWSSMEDLLSEVAKYSNGESTLGYSVFYYVSNMYPDPSVRMVAINGIYPSKESIADDSYPYVSYYYAVFRSDLPKEDPLRQLVEFLLTDEGQRLVEAAGYVPLRPLGEEANR